MNMSETTKTNKASEATPWSPFRHRAFSVLWIATVVSNIGTWMNDVGAGWLMTSLAPTPLMVSMVQAATTLPMFLFALPAGALADIFDRRKILIIVTAVMILTAAPMGIIVLNNAMTPTGLLLFTFALGSGAAFIAPIWQAIIPGLVAKEILQSAVALNSVGINISRAIGPAVGGIAIVLFGIAWPFLLNAASFLAVIIAFLWWRPEKQTANYFPRERFLSAIQTGLRYTRSSPAFKTALARAIAFFPFASAYWGLLPLIVRQELGGGPELYGLLLGSVGAGGVAGALLLPILKSRIGTDNVVVVGSISMVMVIMIFAFTRQPAIAIFTSVLAGIS